MSTAEEREAKAKARPEWFPQEELFDQGKKIILRPGGSPSSDGFFTGSKIVREWYILIQPTVQSALDLVTAGIFWNVTASLEVGYISTSGVRFLRPLRFDIDFRVPVAGMCIPVHGSFARLTFNRTIAPIIAGIPQKDMEIVIFGLPGWPHPWDFPSKLAVAGGSGSVSVPTLAYAYSISGQLDVGDTINQEQLNGTLVQGGVPVTPEFANGIQPLDPDTGTLRYFSAVGKLLLIKFYFRT